jgi:hypothetical protein
VRLGGDVPLAIEEQHALAITGRTKEMPRDDADRQVRLRGVAAMAVLANDSAVTPRCDQQRAGGRAATRVQALSAAGTGAGQGGVIASAYINAGE